jgi:hypothetical protein
MHTKIVTGRAYRRLECRFEMTCGLSPVMSSGALPGPSARRKRMTFYFPGTKTQVSRQSHTSSTHSQKPPAR